MEGKASQAKVGALRHSVLPGVGVSTFTLPATCPQCAGPLCLVNARATGTVSLAILACDPCEWEYEVLMRIERHGRTQGYADRMAREKLDAKRRAKVPVLVS